MTINWQLSTVALYSLAFPEILGRRLSHIGRINIGFCYPDQVMSKKAASEGARLKKMGDDAQIAALCMIN